MSQFFALQRTQFFRPFVGKYRAQTVECVVELYRRLYSASQADYGQALTRDTLVEIFQEALVRAPLLSADDDSDDGRFTTSREQAGWVLAQLLEHGWLEKQVDTTNLQSTYGFSRFGRLFTEPFCQDNKLSAHTRHRNTRNTRNALEAFLERGDIYDLLDAYDYSERIISDFTDVISELDERKRDLVREMEGQLLVQHASEAFFEFMENRFQPDISVRLSADNVEKHRDYINQLILKIRKKDKAFKAQAERRLREQLPELSQSSDSVLWYVLDGIEQRLRNASDIMLPALRKALQSFTKRADIIIRQLSYLASQQHNDVLAVCKHLANLNAVQQDRLLLNASEQMATPAIGLIDPASIRLSVPKARTIQTQVVDDGQGQVDQSARRELYVQQLLDQAFLVNQQAVKRYLYSHLSAGSAVSSRALPIHTAQDFLAVAHAIGLGAQDNSSSDFSLHVYPDPSVETQRDTDTYFLAKDHFMFELVEK